MGDQIVETAGDEQEQALQYSMDASEQFEGVHKLTETVLNTIPRNAGDLTQEQYDVMKDMVESVRRIAAEHKPKVLENYDMPVNEVKDIILKECSGGTFYPSDISEKHGVDYDTVAEAVEQLRKEGRVAEPSSRVMAAKTHEDVVKEFRSSSLNDIADRIERLRKSAADSNGGVDFDLKSLRQMASMLLSHSYLPAPQLTVDDAGCAHAMWKMPDSGVILMVFLPYGMVRYRGVFQPPESSGPQWNTQGVLPLGQVMSTLQPFLRMDMTD